MGDMGDMGTITNLKSKVLNLKLLFCLLLAAYSFAATNYVWQGSSTPTPPYNSWETAAHNIQDAVNSAIEGNVVLVTNGSYTLFDYIRIYTNDIILKGLSGAVETEIIGDTSLAQCIYLQGISTVDGFTIKNGKRGIYISNGGMIKNCIITNNIYSWGYGSAVYAQKATISNCYLAGNTAFQGGAVHLRSDCLVEDCVIENNTANNGGGISFSEINSVVKNCIIKNNTATNGSSNGGGIFCGNTGPENLITNCYIKNNQAKLGGGVYLKDSAMLNCVIENNYATDNGAGIYLNNSGIVSDCSISNNVAYIRGGGAYCNTGGEIFNCLFTSNSAEYGGGINCIINGSVTECQFINNNAVYYGGGAYVNSGASFSKCIFLENSANNYGGGVYTFWGGSFTDCVISNNNSLLSGGGTSCNRGGSFTNCLVNDNFSLLYGGGSSFNLGGEMYNCTVTKNTANRAGGGIYSVNGAKIINTIIYNNTAVASNENCQASGSNIVYSFCCTIPITNLPNSYGCMTNNPEFISQINDFHLEDFSPCRNAGTNMAWMIGATDLDGNPRLTGGTVDIGCYEFIPEPGAFGAVISYLLLVIGRKKFKFIKI